jgi:hypothetical protein
MVKVGKYTTLQKDDVLLEDVVTALEWTVETKVTEAVLLTGYKVKMPENSKTLILLDGATLTLSFDGEPILKKGPLFGGEWPLPMGRVFLMAIDGDEYKGVFVANGTVIQATVELSRKPSMGLLTLGIEFQADLYRNPDVNP